MATSQLQCLVSPIMGDIEEMVDVIAVPGLGNVNETDWLGYVHQGIPAWLQGCPNARISLFTYDLDNMFIQQGVQVVAAQLLASVSRLEAEIIPVRHVPVFANPKANTVRDEALFLPLSCPTRLSLNSQPLLLQHAVLRLIEERAHVNNIPTTLTTSLANVTVTINQEFLSTNLLFDISIINITSLNDDEKLRVFDPYETSMSIRSNGDDFRRLQVGLPSPHSTLGKDVPSLVTSFLPSTVDRGYHRHPALKLLMSEGFSKTSDVSPVSRHPLPSSISTAILPRTLSKRSLYFAFHEPNDVAGLLSSIRQHLIHESFDNQIHQTFEFRDWDIRCSSVESMLCTFLASLPRCGHWQGILDDFHANVIESHSWSCQLLLSTFYDYFSEALREQPNLSITWILANFDTRITSYHWLLSNLCELLRNSELPFTLIIINSNPPDTMPFNDCFEIIALDPDITNGLSEGESSVQQSDNAILETLELISEAPGLYPVQEYLLHLVQSWNETSRIRKHFFEWFRLRKNQILPLDVEQLLNYSHVTEAHLFRRIWLPSRTMKVLREQTFLAASLLCHALHPLTVQQLMELEQNTDYGMKIGYKKEDRGVVSPRTLLLLTGVLDVCNNEVHFRDIRFRDYFVSEIVANNEDSIISADQWSKQTHSQLAKWCLQRIGLSTTQEWSKFRAVEGDSIDLVSHRSFLSYAVRYWIRHAQMAHENVEVDSLIHSILDDKDLLHEWTRAYWSLLNPATRGNQSAITPLAIFAEHEAESLFEATMTSYEEDPRFEHMKLRALEICARKDIELDDLLLWCFPSRNHLVVQEVMEMATNQASRFRNPSAILTWAAYYGFRDVAQMMIPLIPRRQVAASGFMIVNSALQGSRMDEDTGLEIISLLVDSKYPRIGSLSRTLGFFALYEACKIGLPRIAAFLSRSIFPDKPDASQGQAERPPIFTLAVEHAIQATHDKTLKSLLEFGLEMNWLDIPWLGRLIEFARPMKVWRCCKTLSSYAIILSGDSESLKAFAGSLLHDAFVHGSLAVFPDLLALWGGLKSSELSSLLEPVIRAGKDAVDILNFLLDEGSTRCDEETYLQVLKHHLNDAVNTNNTEVARILLTKATIVDTERPSGNAIVFHAAFNGYKDMVDLLLESKANLNVYDIDGWSPVHAAYDYPDILESLLKAGADSDVKAKDGSTALLLTCKYYLPSAKLLLEHGAKACAYVDNMTELSTAVAWSNEDIACMLLEYGANPLEYSAKELDRPLLHACVGNNLLRPLKLLLLYNFSVDEKDKDGNTAFNSITNATDVTVLKILKNRGGSINIANEEGQVPLSKAISWSNQPVFQWLLEEGADVNINIGIQGSVLHMACFEGSLEMVELLCQNKASLSVVNHANSSPLHEALLSSHDDKEDIIDYLLNMKGLDVNHNSDVWGGCLNIACLNNNINVVEALLKAKATVDARDKIGRAPIHFALYRTTAYIKVLLEAGASLDVVDHMKRNALHFAVASGRLDVVTFVLDENRDFIHKTDIDGWSPLMWAVRICGRWDTQEDERAKIVTELIRLGANTQISGEGLDRKWTAYQLAHYYGHGQDMINLLESSDDKQLDNPKTAKQLEGSYCDACLMLY
ncbi:unnamed protein product [Fusarium venenatum]|uniref:Uncharacterized protein n=1 Tax=Fusarium venenatum TaxID=56646 RepID=A0A2L2T9T8_9HYPO|nr:uncharacterized protein FVRRES_13669 [Fusarium venenatum]CEI41633.1 unnamed protein product [Fusarium venenatum]